MNTLLLDTHLWDLVLDASGNIAMASEPYAIAQDVASAIKLFAGELWYDNTRGIPYFDQILGQYPPAGYLASQFEQAALTVPGVVQAQCSGLQLSGRKLTGQVEVIDVAGQSQNVSFTQ